MGETVIPGDFKEVRKSRVELFALCLDEQYIKRCDFLSEDQVRIVWQK